MENLIKTINKLQDVFTTIQMNNPIDLPQIVVIGSQSSGKSSVLENIVGRDFLPRGSGIVTRRPLILQLIHTPVGSIKDRPEEWGEFLHNPGEIFADFSKICDEIVKDTDVKTGGDKGISPNPINLKIFSPHVLNLTLVDLPGMTKVPVGNQPADIELQIRNMCTKFIAKKNAIILAVTAANTDLANSDGLNLARQVDPEGVRTIGVLTKIDIMDEGTHVLEILAGRVIPLRLGYVPVVNRSQKSIDNHSTIKQALQAEKAFFENHPAYATKAQYCGTPFLSRKLNIILMHHIRECLPEMKTKIAQQLQKYRLELSELGSPLNDGENSSNTILNVITEFCADFRAVLDGHSENLSSSELSGGARISFVFHEIYANGIREIDPFDQISDTDIRTILYNSSGSSPALFVSGQSFEVLIRQQIKRLEEPSFQCVVMIYDELIRILGHLESRKIFKRFPTLKEKFRSAVVAFFRKALEPTNKLVLDVIKAESGYINTAHPDFLSGHKAMAIVNERSNFHQQQILMQQQQQQQAMEAQQQQQQRGQQPGQPGQPLPQTARPQLPPPQIPTNQPNQNTGFFSSFFAKPKGGEKRDPTKPLLEQPPAALRAQGVLSEREGMETEVIKLLLQSYFDIVKRTVADMVPKCVMLNLVCYSKQNMQRELLTELYKSNDYEDILKESEYVVSRRNECKKMIEILSKAEDAIGAV
eukprot:Lithocolla_globosa_v1_NODE_1173_length_2812_cov_7.424374.p1 type:complete len:702 gc:universal NODE_1173_length_2812_cov_7.424374:2180-75(-)